MRAWLKVGGLAQGLSHALAAEGFRSNAAFLTGSQVAGATLGLITTAVAARSLGPSAFGTAAVVMAYPLAASSLTTTKSGPVMLRYAVRFKAIGDNEKLLAICKLGFGLDVLTTAAAVALVGAGLLVVGDLPGASGYAVPMILFSLSLPFMTFRNTGFMVLTAFRKLRRAAVLHVVERALVLAVVSGALIIEPSVEAFLIGTALGQALAGSAWVILPSVLLNRSVGSWWRSRLASLPGEGPELRAILSWNFLGATVGGALQQLPVLLLGALHSPTAAGYFRLATSLTSTLDHLEIALMRASAAPLAEAHESGDGTHFERLLRRWSRVDGPVAAGLALIALASLPVLVPLAFGPEYRPMLAGTAVMALGIVASTAFFYVTPALFAQGRVKLRVVAYGSYGAIALAAGSLLGPQAGFIGFALPIGLGLMALNIGLGLYVLASAKADRWAVRGT